MRNVSLRFAEAWRALRRAPGFSLAVVLLLAVGIGLNDAIFTVVDAVLLQPIGFHEADRIVALESHLRDRATPGDWIGGDDYTDVAHGVHGLEATAFYSAYGPTGVQLGGQASYLRMTAVSPAFPAVLGVEPVAGRLFQAQDAEGTGALLSAGLATSRFGSPSAALGQMIQAGGMSRTVLGVLPSSFAFPDRTEVWLETGPKPANGSRTSGNQAAVGRRSAGTSETALAAEMRVFSDRLAATFPEDHGKRLEPVPLKDELVGQVRPTLHLLMGAASVVLLIVCVNITHLQMARGTRRLRSATLRTALGASRAQLALAALTESALLAVLGALAAAAVALPSLHLLLRLAPPDLPRLAEVRPNVTVFALSFVLSTGLMALTAVLPILRAWRSDPASVLRRDGSRGLESRGTQHLRSGLLVAEVAMTLSLALVALVFAERLFAAGRADVGFAADRLLTVDAHLTGLAPLPDPPAAPPAGKNTAAQRTAYVASATGIAQTWQIQLEAVLTQARAQPGVTAAAAMEGAPMGFGAVDVRYAIDGRTTFGPDASSLPVGYVHAGTPELFATLGVPVLRGRSFGAADRFGTPSVVVINAALAREQFPGQDPIGQRLRCGYDFDDSGWTVVGVVGDIQAETPGAQPQPTMYVPLAQHPEKSPDLQLMVRTAGDPGTLAPALTASLRRSFPSVAMEVSTMRQNMVETERMDRLRTVLFSGFGVISLLLAAAGIYGVTAYVVAQQRFVFGLRFALGATRTDVLGRVLGRSLAEAGIGSVLGLLLAFLVPRVLASVLGAVPPPPLGLSVAACAAMLLVVALAALGPAGQAARVQPAAMLRES